MGPKWPVSFNLLEGEREDWGFVVGAPGAIDVRVQSQGAPIVVSLRKADGNVVEQTGSGDIAIKLQATAADVARSVLWSISVRGANAALPPATGGKRELRPVARGTVNVAHPQGDARRAETELKALAQQVRVGQARPQTNQSSTAALVAKRRAEIDQQTAARQAQMLERLRASIPAAAYQRASARIAARRTTDTAAIGPQVRQQAAQFLATQAPPGGAPAQSAGALVPLSADAAPAITSLSVNEGQPGDPVLITGTSLGDQAGEVHFIVGNGSDLVAPVMHWTGTQAFVTVPEKSGVLAFNGLVYIVATGGKKSAGTAFGFRPAIDVQSVPIAFNAQSSRFGSPYFPDGGTTMVTHHVEPALSILCFCGGKGDDEVYLHGESLKNNWQIDGVDVRNDLTSLATDTGAERVSVVDFRPGTSSKYVRFHWWFGWGEFITYRASFVVSGPKGLPPE